MKDTAIMFLTNAFEFLGSMDALPGLPYLPILARRERDSIEYSWSTRVLIPMPHITGEASAAYHELLIPDAVLVDDERRRCLRQTHTHLNDFTRYLKMLRVSGESAEGTYKVRRWFALYSAALARGDEDALQELRRAEPGREDLLGFVA